MGRSFLTVIANFPGSLAVSGVLLSGESYSYWNTPIDWSLSPSADLLRSAPDRFRVTGLARRVGGRS